MRNTSSGQRFGFFLNFVSCCARRPTDPSSLQDRIVMGAERKSQYIDEHVKKLTAYHEGGHALAALYTPGSMPLHKVTCVPRGHALGVVRPGGRSKHADDGSPRFARLRNSPRTTA